MATAATPVKDLKTGLVVNAAELAALTKPARVLDWRVPQKVKYAVPLWLRDEQIKLNCKKVTGRIQDTYPDVQDEPIAIVCYGPSLKDTWEQLRDFKVIATCSGAHRFLIDRGIIPTYHLAVDPLPTFQEKLMGEPHPDVEYLIASTCHPGVLDYLKGFNVKLWHVFDPEEDVKPVLPLGEWCFRGGPNVGLRAMAIASFMGYQQQHVFGMDGSEGATGKHADAHPNQAKSHQLVEYNGVMYRTTVGFLESARQTWHELDQMPKVTARFYGEGLVQAMAKDYVRQPPKGVPALATIKHELISEEYRALNIKLHETSLAYGVGGSKHADLVKTIAEKLKTTSILDYGCGKGMLAKELPFPIWEYDPAIPGKDSQPRPADVVVCTDVLEHVEIEKILRVLDDLHRCTRVALFAVIHTGASGKTLEDGRNSHILQRDAGWWRRQIECFFRVDSWRIKGPLITVVAAPKGKKKPKAEPEAPAVALPNALTPVVTLPF